MNTTALVAPDIRIRKFGLLAALGPAFVASVAYMDPGNFATNISAGSQFGYMLLWVVVASNIMAMLVQTLAAKLGIATGQNLAEVCRDTLPKPLVYLLWFVMEIAAMATDVAEFVGAAVGFHLLLGAPLWFCAVLAAIVTFFILSFQTRGHRWIEGIIMFFVGIIGVCYVVETILEKPDWSKIAVSAVVPRLSGSESVLLAVGILGATVMPHAIYLHSSLTQNRIVPTSPKDRRRLHRLQMFDVGIAMGIAGLINAAMLIMAAATFFRAGMHEVGTLEQAYRTLEPLLGKAASWFFGISLLASGLSSTVVGTMAGQVMMQGFLRFQIPLIVRRVVTLLPSFIIILSGVDTTRALVWSQVILSFALPGALVPLIFATSRRRIMGDLTNHRLTTIAGWLVATVVVALNAYLLFELFRPSR